VWPTSPFADLPAYIVKEGRSAGADKAVFSSADDSFSPGRGCVVGYSTNAGVADINVAVLFYLAVSSLDVYGVTAAGPATKVPVLSLRSAAQMIFTKCRLLIITGDTTGSLNLAISLPRKVATLGSRTGTSSRISR
jgi:NADH-quinone oxidoreductase subunit H